MKVAKGLWFNGLESFILHWCLQSQPRLGAIVLARREANGKTISLHSCIFLEIIIFFLVVIRQCHSLRSWKKILFKLLLLFHKMLKQVGCYEAIQEIDERRHGYEKLFKYHNTAPCCLSLCAFHSLPTLQFVGFWAVKQRNFILLEFSHSGLWWCDYTLWNALLWAVSCCLNDSINIWEDRNHFYLRTVPSFSYSVHSKPSKRWRGCYSKLFKHQS